MSTACQQEPGSGVVAIAAQGSSFHHLAEETLSGILVDVDPKTILRSRRVCGRWREWIDRSELVWRSIALSWGLIDHLAAPLCGQPQLSVYEAQALSSAMSYFEGIKSFKTLCCRYLTLTLTWHTPAVFQKLASKGEDLQEHMPCGRMILKGYEEGNEHLMLVGEPPSVRLIARVPGADRVNTDTRSPQKFAERGHQWLNDFDGLEGNLHPTIPMQALDIFSFDVEWAIVARVDAGLETCIEVWNLHRHKPGLSWYQASWVKSFNLCLPEDAGLPRAGAVSDSCLGHHLSAYIV
ncbi:F-box domain [Ceraceosorus bombacis]|uniref:F-box domain n=1 Tax=Ceraceosorus bombacis TaxID=401625 RepID=A0A0P1BFW8_9BASI|nr:F-box domain [Ceraceosorus bombacis]